MNAAKEFDSGFQTTYEELKLDAYDRKESDLDSASRLPMRN